MILTRIRVFALAVIAAVLSSVAVQAQAPTLSDFAALPAISNVAISPDGKRVAVLARQGETAYAAVFDLEAGSYVGEMVAVTDIQARRVGWANNDVVLVWVSDIQASMYFTVRKVNFGAVFAFHWRDGKMKQLLRRAPDLAINSNLGNVVSNVTDGESIRMAAYATLRGGSGRVYSVFDVDLKSGRGRVHARGDTHTQRFIADETGKIYARVDFNDEREHYEVLAYRTERRAELIYENRNTKLSPFIVAGLTPDKQSLVITKSADDNAARVYHMSLVDGSITGPVFEKQKAHLLNFIKTTASDVVHGVAFTDIEGGDYHFYDPQLQKLMDRMKKALPNSSVRPVSWSSNLDDWIFFAEGGFSAGAFLHHRRSTNATNVFAERFPEVTSEYIAPVMSIEYKARDGLTIPSILTLPVSGETKNLPTIILPHGGPESHDALGWDWMAQYFANQGYAVLQPNFRGSDGFGYDHLAAGWGEYGHGMQHDVTDGLKALVKAGYTDPQRVCIVGWSYGGYSALAGAVFTPELYNCAVAIAPVTNLNRHLRYIVESFGGDSAAVFYETREMRGVDGSVDLRERSPVRFAENVQAPVLLIHGRDDTVVPVAHSREMKRALERAGKDVKYLEFSGQDHSMRLPETRIAAMEAMANFIDEYIGE